MNGFLVYALLPNKEKKTYIRFLKALIKVCKKYGIFKPKAWGVDYELGTVYILGH